MSQIPRKSSIECHLPLYSLDWSSSGSVALSTFREDFINKIIVLDSSTDPITGEFNFYEMASSDILYPATHISWAPNQGSRCLATSSQYLQIWEVGEDPSGRTVIQDKVKLINSKLNMNSLPPLTSFDWNSKDPSLIITSSIDTTCTVWDISKQAVKTQLIAHDSEVFDVCFLADSVNSFLSVGADGSLRLFDLRSLEHSTIVYEPTGVNKTSLLRLDVCRTDTNLVAVVAKDNFNIPILDLRYPGSARSMLNAHQGCVNSVSWHPSKQALLSCADDCQAMVWDLTQTVASSLPHYVYSTTSELNNGSWNHLGDWLGTVSGRTFQAVKTY